MEPLHPRCAGLDIHKSSIVACVRIVHGTQVTKLLESFGTGYAERLRLGDWLSHHRVTAVLMEATGVYWRPIWLDLEADFTVVVANALHVKNVPGRKSDVNDASWLSDLMAHGLCRPSFIPPQDIQALRDLTRLRKQLVREKAQHQLRIHKALESCGFKLASVVSDVMGQTGRAILKGLCQGEKDPQVLANLALGNARKKRAQLVEALRGHPTDHLRFLLQLHLDQIARLEQTTAQLEQHTQELMRPFFWALELLVTIPGISLTTAHVILAEVGGDMSRFPDAAHLRSWAGLCPQMNESAGKRKNTRLRKGAPWLKTTLVQAAWSAVRTKDSYLRALYYRIQGNTGCAKKAIVAVAAAMLTAVYHMLKDRVPYKELGPEPVQPQLKEKTINKLRRRLERLTGARVELTTAPVPLAA